MSSPDRSRPIVRATGRPEAPCGDPPADSGPIEALKGVRSAPAPINCESMPDGLRARFDDLRLQGHMVAVKASVSNAWLPN